LGFVPYGWNEAGSALSAELCTSNLIMHAFHSFICLKMWIHATVAGQHTFGAGGLLIHLTVSLHWAMLRPVANAGARAPAPKVGAPAPRLMSQHHEVPYHNTNVGSVPRQHHILSPSPANSWLRAWLCCSWYNIFYFFSLDFQSSCSDIRPTKCSCFCMSCRVQIQLRQKAGLTCIIVVIVVFLFTTIMLLANQAWAIPPLSKWAHHLDKEAPI